MKFHETHLQVRFNEIDAYNVAWHGHYVAWMEVGRNDLAGRFGMDARQLAELGYLGPVVSLEVKYLSPARFKGSDASFNVGCAVGAVQSLPPGVYICMSGKVFEAGTVRKNRAAGRFESLG